MISRSLRYSYSIFTFTILTCALLLMSFSAHAVSFQNIQSGHWAIEGEEGPGSGINISIQNDRLALTIFTYDDMGNATWLTSNGFLFNQLGVPSFRGELSTATAGTPVADESFLPAELVTTGQLVSLRFNTRTTGELRVGNTIKSIRYLRFAGKAVRIPGNFEQEQSAVIPDLEGEWVFVSRNTGIATNTRVFQFRRVLPVDADQEETAIVYEDFDNELSSARIICAETAFTVFEPEQVSAINKPLCTVEINDSERITQFDFIAGDITPDRIGSPTTFNTQGFPGTGRSPEIFLLRLGDLE